MDYSRIYIELMERSFERELEGYVEKHHIVPKCMGGDDKERNLAVLTPEEHYVAHQLLVKIYPKNYKLLYAIHLMCAPSPIQIRGARNNKLYGWIRRRTTWTPERRKEQSQLMMGNTFGVGRKQSDEQRLNASKRMKGNQNTLGYKASEQTKMKLSKSLIGNKHALGMAHTDETKEKISKKLKGRKCSKEEVEKRNGSKHYRAKPIQQFSKNMSFIEEFTHITPASIKTGIDISGIHKCCLGKLKSSGGFIWRYKL